MTERLHFHFSCIGEGNGNPLQCSCLENPRDGGAWWAAAYGVAKSQIRLSDFHFHYTDFPVAQMVKNLPVRFNPWVGKFLWRREWQSTPVFLPGEFHRQRSLVSYKVCGGRKKLDTTERLTHTDTSQVNHCVFPLTEMGMCSTSISKPVSPLKKSNHSLAHLKLM